MTNHQVPSLIDRTNDSHVDVWSFTYDDQIHTVVLTATSSTWIDQIGHQHDFDVAIDMESEIALALEIAIKDRA